MASPGPHPNEDLASGPAPSEAPAPHTSAELPREIRPGARLTGVLSALGALIAAASLIALALTLVSASTGDTPPPWAAGIALYGLPLAFALVALVLFRSVLGRRRR